MRKVSRGVAMISRRFSFLLLALGFLPVMAATVAVYVNVLEPFLLVWQIILAVAVVACMFIAVVLWTWSYAIWENFCTPCVEVDVQGITFRVYEPVVTPTLVKFDIRFFPDRKASQQADVKNLILADEMLPSIYCAMAESLLSVGYMVERNRWRTHRNLCNHGKGGKGSWFSIEPIRTDRLIDPVYIFDYGMDQFDF
jgi:hypothetical protein